VHTARESADRDLVWVNYGAQKNIAGSGSLGEWDWKIVVIFQLLVPILIVAQTPFIPESPRCMSHR